MILTEAEAKTRQCPEGIVRQPIAAHHEFQYGVPNCIASGCMAWRWVDEPPANRVSGEDKWRGYCGKAGHPYPAFIIGERP